MIRKTRLKSIKKQHDKNYLQEIISKDRNLVLGNDTYAMAFRAFNWYAMRDMGMKMSEVHNAFHASMFVFGIQLIMIYFVYFIIFGPTAEVVPPANLSVIVARFLCSILMHLQVEGDLRQGLKMMKYVTNQPFDFSNPSAAFSVAMMQCLGGLAAEIGCIVYLSSLNKALDVIIKFVALSSIAKVDDFYAAALPADGNKVKGRKCKPLQINVHQRDWKRFSEHSDISEYEPMAKSGLGRKIQRFIFKVLRIIYASYIFYFLPYTMLWLPYIF